MSNVIEELFYGNLEPQELTTEITPKLKKAERACKEEDPADMLPEKEKELSATSLYMYENILTV